MFTLDDPQEVLEFLVEPIQAVRAALDHGVSWATAMLEGRPHDPHMWAHLVRYEARNRLGSGTASWSVRPLANSGIEIASTPLVMRAMKSHEGGPPPPGHSRTRRAFWSQQPWQGTLALSWDGIREPTAGANLILGWMRAADGGVDLALAKPIATWKYKGQPRLAWSRPVEFDDEDVPRFVVADETVDVEPRFELDELSPEGEAS
jgi:hypothetical protein